MGHVVTQLLEALRYNREVAGSIILTNLQPCSRHNL